MATDLDRPTCQLGDGADPLRQRSGQVAATLQCHVGRSVDPFHPVGANAEHPDRTDQALQLEPTEVDELEAGDGAEHPHRCRRQQDLAPMRRAHDSSGPIHGRTEVVTVALLGLAGVGTHANEQGERRRPRLGLQATLCTDRRSDCVGRTLKCSPEPITTAREHDTVVRLDELTNDGIVASQSAAHQGRVLLLSVNKNVTVPDGRTPTTRSLPPRH